MAKGIFITATGTDVGKTYVSALLVKKLRNMGLNAGYYKSVLSGAISNNGILIPQDAEYVNRIANIGASLDDMVSYVYENAVSPHLAAKMEGRPVQAEKILEDYYRASGKYEYLTVEGSGGIVCPIRVDEKEFMLTDFIKAFNLSVLIVSSAKLGDINKCVLTVEYAKNCGIDVKGIILNRFNAGNILEEDNKKMIEYLTKVPVIACVEDNAEDIEFEDITSLYEESSKLWN